MPRNVDFGAAGTGVTSLEIARSRLQSAAGAAIPGAGTGIALQRCVLEWLVELGVKESFAGGYQLHAVNAAPLGEAVVAAVAVNGQLRALYKTPGYTMAQLLQQLVEKGLAKLTFSGTTKYAAALPGPLVQQLVAAEVGADASRRDVQHTAAAYSGINGRSTASVAAPAVRVDHMPTVQMVTSEQQAAVAVARLMAAREVAMDCEGDLERGGSIALIQLFALPSSHGIAGSSSAPSANGNNTAAAACYVFDVHAMAEGERQGAMRSLARLLESPDTVKVLHDCRSDCEALFYLHGIRCAAVWDTQVAFGLLQFLTSVGSGSKGGVNAPVGLNALLQQYDLPPNPLKKVMHARMDREPHLFTRRPLEAQVLNYAVADVWQLLPAKACLEADLGPAAALKVPDLSLAYSEWCLDAGDRSCGVGSSSYAAAVRLPLGQDLEMAIEPPDYRPRYTPAVPAQAADEEDEPPVALPAEAAVVEPCGAADDPDTRLVLELFPEHIRAAIVAALRAEEEAASAAAQAAATAAAAGGNNGALAEAESADAAVTASAAEAYSGGVQMVEAVVDRGRPLRVRLSSGTELVLEEELSVEDALDFLAAAKGRLRLGGGGKSTASYMGDFLAAAKGRLRLGGGGANLFYADNRTGIPGTLHRVSAMRDRQGGIAGLTYRVGRHVPGVGRLVLDILHGLSRGHDATGHEVQDAISPSLLLLGGPGVGKTTLLRDVASLLSDTFSQKVVVVDTSNEVAGDGSEPHACIGSARRMMVPSQQHSVMIETVQNHMPDVVIVDEIGTAREVEACRSIAHRGVVLVGTAHGRSLKALMRNPDLNGLIGGIHQVTLGDEEARRSNHGSKTRTERRGEPAFSTLVEVLSRSRWRVHMSVARSVDDMLAGREPSTQLRWVTGDGRMMVRLEGQPAGAAPGSGDMRGAVNYAASRLGPKGAWFEALLDLAALY